jgi:protein-disulfide isomerase
MYSDTTYSNYDVWTKAESGEQIIEMLNSYGLQFGLEDDQLNSCLKDEDYQNKLLELQIGAQEIFGVESTPTFLINGQKVAGNRPASEFIKIIKEKLNQ